MILAVLLVVAGTAFAEAPRKAVDPNPEETLRVMLLKLRHPGEAQMSAAVVGGAEELRDAVHSGSGAARVQLANRLPGVSPDPFDLCRDLARCPQAPQSLHVEDADGIDDALMALARPWFKLQKARGKGVDLLVDRGVGVQLGLEDVPGLAKVTLTATPAETGGFDVAVEDAPGAPKIYSDLRAAVLAPEPKK